jgi:nucleoside 2-deoxyribosyltransferase
MNIYFACTITGGRDYEGIYRRLVDALLSDGHTIPTAHLADSNVMELETVVAPREVFARDVDWIRACDVLIAEVSVPSHGVGYEIGFALGLGKRVLCLHHETRRVSKMITGNPDPLLQVKAYRDADHAVKLARMFLQSS